MGHSAFPLEWPEGRKRREPWNRKPSKFRDLGFGKCRDDLLRACKRFGARDVVLSTEVALNLKGLPYASAREPSDPGVALYFDIRSYNDATRVWDTKHYAIACDQYRKVAENLRALVHTIDAMNAISRHGSSELLEQAMSGFAALPEASKPDDWWIMLGVARQSPAAVVKAAWRFKVSQAHPDVGGSADEMAKINAALERAESEIAERQKG